MEQNILQKLNETKEFIRQRTSIRPKIGLILGSGLGNLLESSSEDIVFPYSELPFFPVSTVEGHAGKLILGQFCGVHTAVMQGRVHYYEGYSMDEVIYPVRLMKMLGVDYLVITAAAGGINISCRPGDLVLIKDHINLMGACALRGRHYPEFGERFPDMSDIYTKELRELAARIAKKNRVRAIEGVYTAVAGPVYETPAEIKAFRKLGGDVVGMSVVPEALAAHQMGMAVLALAYVANPGAGVKKKTLSHREVLLTGKSAGQRLSKLIPDIVEKIARLTPDTPYLPGTFK